MSAAYALRYIRRRALRDGHRFGRFKPTESGDAGRAWIGWGHETTPRRFCIIVWAPLPENRRLARLSADFCKQVAGTLYTVSYHERNA